MRQLYFIVGILIFALSSCEKVEDKKEYEVNIETPSENKSNQLNSGEFSSLINHILDSKEYELTEELVGLVIPNNYDNIEGSRIGIALINDKNKVIGFVDSFASETEFIIIMQRKIDDKNNEIVDVIILPKLSDKEKLISTSGELDSNYLQYILIITEDDLIGDTIENYRYICKFNSKKWEIDDITDEDVFIYLEEG